MPPLGTPPRGVGVAPPIAGLPNGGRLGNRAMGPTNREVSGREKKPPPPEKEVWWLSGRAPERDGVLLAGALASSSGRGVLPSNEDRV